VFKSSAWEFSNPSSDESVRRYITKVFAKDGNPFFRLSPVPLLVVMFGRMFSNMVVIFSVFFLSLGMDIVGFAWIQSLNVLD
jgi:hypothetical protein